jgi:hypothetical protein
MLPRCLPIEILLRHIPSIDYDLRPRHPTCSIPSEEDGRLSNILRYTQPAPRVEGRQHLGHRLSGLGAPTRSFDRFKDVGFCETGVDCWK